MHIQLAGGGKQRGRSRARHRKDATSPLSLLFRSLFLGFFFVRERAKIAWSKKEKNCLAQRTRWWRRRSNLYLRLYTYPLEFRKSVTPATSSSSSAAVVDCHTHAFPRLLITLLLLCPYSILSLRVRARRSKDALSLWMICDDALGFTLNEVQLRAAASCDAVPRELAD